MQRRLSAILAADVVGYTRLMERDEAGTLDALREARHKDVSPIIERFDGRIFKLMGDGLLAEFASVVNAVHAAIEIQRATAERNSVREPDSRIELRIGINLGDIIVDEDDIYGDGVNVAGRLQELAEPGCVCISRSVRDQVRDKLAVNLADLGDVTVKNHARPIRVYQLGIEEEMTRVTAVPGAAKQRVQQISSANVRSQGAIIADLAYGGYARPMYAHYEGEYVCARLTFSMPGHYFFYPMSIEWSEEQAALVFEDRNPGFEQRGVVTIPTGAGFVHLVTLDVGSARLITVQHMPDTRTRMFGLVLTLANPSGRQLYPAAASILIERTDRGPLDYAACVGAISRDDPRLSNFPHDMFDEATQLAILGPRGETSG